MLPLRQQIPSVMKMIKLHSILLLISWWRRNKWWYRYGVDWWIIIIPIVTSLLYVEVLITKQLRVTHTSISWQIIIIKSTLCIHHPPNHHHHHHHHHSYYIYLHRHSYYKFEVKQPCRWTLTMLPKNNFNRYQSSFSWQLIYIDSVELMRSMHD